VDNFGIADKPGAASLLLTSPFLDNFLFADHQSRNFDLLIPRSRFTAGWGLDRAVLEMQTSATSRISKTHSKQIG